MMQTLDFLIEANLSLMAVLLVYRLTLSTETNFSVMRIFLQLGIIVSLIIPFIQIANPSKELAIPAVVSLLPSNWLPEVVINGNPTDAGDNGMSTWQVLTYLYLAGATMMFSVFAVRLVSLIKMIVKSPASRFGNLRVVESDSNNQTFSFFNFIYVGNADKISEAEKRQIISHESIHAGQFHSVDILLVNILEIIFWFNPFIRIFKRYFVQLHEFEADARAVENSDVNGYCSLLARVALQSADYPIANHFNNSLTLKRISMIRKIKQRISRWRLIAALAVFPMMFTLLTLQNEAIAQSKPLSPSNEVYEKVDELPSYGSGFPDLASYLGSNIRYPKTAREKKVEGTVFAEFIVEKDGKLSNIQVKKGFDNDCDAEALRVVKAMPAWNPGLLEGKVVRTKMILPIAFKM